MPLPHASPLRAKGSSNVAKGVYKTPEPLRLARGLEPVNSVAIFVARGYCDIVVSGYENRK